MIKARFLYPAEIEMFDAATFDDTAKSQQKRWLSKKPQMQGAQILRNEAYIRYAAVTKDAAQRCSWGVFATPSRFTNNRLHAWVKVFSRLWRRQLTTFAHSLKPGLKLVMESENDRCAGFHIRSFTELIRMRLLS